MNAFLQFLTNNLLPSVLAGLVSWMFIYTVLHIFDIRRGSIRYSLMYVPIVKSFLVTLGIGVVLRWPGSFFENWSANALPVSQVLPFVLIWFGAVILARNLITAREHKKIVARAEQAELVAPRLQRAMTRMMQAFEGSPSATSGDGLIRCVNSPLRRPLLFVIQNGLDSPSVFANHSPPAILFPKELIGRLDDEELALALAHEYSHFLLRNPAWCSSSGIHNVTPISPVASLLAKQLSFEEEKACDDMAVTALGPAPVYAEMLLKSYRFAREQADSRFARMPVLVNLVGRRPSIARRIQRLVGKPKPSTSLRWQNALSCTIWLAVFALFGI